MKHSIIQNDEIKILGIDYFGDPFQLAGEWSADNAIGLLWKQFFELYKSNDLSHFSKINLEKSYEVHIFDDHFAENGVYGVMVGYALNEIAPFPVDFVLKILPSTTYLSLEISGEEIETDWIMIVESILAETKQYRRDPKFFIETGNERSN